MTSPIRRPYYGIYRTLVLGFNIGSANSRAAYSLLDPGQIPKIQHVERFTTRGMTLHESAAPIAVYLDGDSKICAIGGETTMDETIQEAEDEEWTLTEFLDTAEQWADYFRYLFECSRTYILEVESSTAEEAADLWECVGHRIHFVITYPNVADDEQKELLREAVVLAGFMSDDIAKAEPGSKPNFNSLSPALHLVSEGRAALDFYLRSGWKLDRKGVATVVIDAGASTIDIGAYALKANSDGVMEVMEVMGPESHPQGFTVISNRAYAYLEDMFSGSSYVAGIFDTMKIFNDEAKQFQKLSDMLLIRVGKKTEENRKLGIRHGLLKLKGDVVAEFFQPSIDCITETIREYQKSAPLSSVVMMGGFASNGWLFNNVKQALASLGLGVFRPEGFEHAVCEGAISLYTAQLTDVVRSSPCAYGLECSVIYDPRNPEHRSRQDRCQRLDSGKLVFHRVFDVVLRKNAPIREDQEIRCFYGQSASQHGHLDHVSMNIYRYRGTLTHPVWMDDEREHYSLLCTVEVNAVQSQTSTSSPFPGRRSVAYDMEYQWIFSFGPAGLKADLAWTENGSEKRIPAKVSYDISDNDGDDWLNLM